MKNNLKNLILVVLIIAIIGVIGYLIFNAVRSIDYNKNAKNPVVTLEVEGYGQVKIELYPEYAPNTVTHFIKLVQNGYYNGKVFQGTDGQAVAAGMQKNEETVTETTEVVENADSTTEEPKSVVVDTLKVSDIDKSVISTDEEYPEEEADSSKDFEISIPGEFVANGFNDNTLRFEKGTVGLYRQNWSLSAEIDLTSESYNSGTSIFFIETEEDSSLNGQYAAFGKVIEGMEIIEEINKLPVEEGNSESINDSELIQYFQTLPVITKATVETYGIDYGMPEYQEAFDYNQYISDLLLQYYGAN